MAPTSEFVFIKYSKQIPHFMQTWNVCVVSKFFLRTFLESKRAKKIAYGLQIDINYLQKA